jgi:ribonuclease VapC
VVVDTSVFVCVLLMEPEAPAFEAALSRASAIRLSSVTWCESAIIMTSKRGDMGLRSLGELLGVLQAQVVAVDANVSERAFSAWLRYGKGRHPAGLNFGDCFSYALASTLDEPLLFKGDDFSKTDLTPAFRAGPWTG